VAFSLNSSNSLFTNSVSVAGYPFSMTGWFRVPDVTASVSLTGLVSFSTGARCDLIFAGDGGKEAVAKTANGSSSSALSTSAMIPGQWHHLAAVFASDSERTIYLDGGSIGVNTDSISIGTLDFYYFGNISSATAIDVAEVSLIKAALDAQQVAALAKGCPVLALTSARDLIAYQDCIRSPNRPGLGPVLSMAGGATIVDQPRGMSALGVSMSAMSGFVRGPMRVEQSHFRSLSAAEGQMSNVGVVSTNAIFPGEVVS